MKPIGAFAYRYLIFALAFYLFAQAYQQYVLLAGPLAGVQGLHSAILVSTHPLNVIRHVLIYLSMFLMLPAFVMLALRYQMQKIFSRLAIIFFCTFCLIEIGYRSVYLFQYLNVTANEYALAAPEAQQHLLPQIQNFFAAIEKIYLPLLIALLLGSLFMLLASAKAKTNWMTIAMAVSVVQQVSRLAGYTALSFLNVFSGIWYFVLVAITFGSLLIYVYEWRQQTIRHNA
ncbi:MAG: hypothetical protein KF763_08460 [Cyclobacteriaceae bacterium]|nr:hypothetical protein [Cyclobacteriaceae bacterium]